MPERMAHAKPDNQEDGDPAELVALNGRLPRRLRAAMRANSRKGPDMQLFTAAAILAALRCPRTNDLPMVEQYELWVSQGCPEIEPASMPESEAHATGDERKNHHPPPAHLKRRRAG